MPLLNKATTFILNTLLQNEELKKFPKDFIDASVKWVSSWFLEDDPKIAAKLKSDKSKEYKEGVIEMKLEDLLKNEQFKKELENHLSKYDQLSAAQQTNISNTNSISQSTINTGGGDFNMDNSKQEAGRDIVTNNNYYAAPTNTENTIPDALTTPTASPTEKRQLQDLIGKNRTPEVMQALLNLSENHLEFRKLVNAQKERWTALQRKEMMNLIGFSEAGIERAKIVNAVLKMIGMLG